MGFLSVYDTTRLYEQIGLPIFGPAINFWVGQEVGQPFSDFFGGVELIFFNFPWVFQWYMTQIYLINPIFTRF